MSECWPGRSLYGNGYSRVHLGGGKYVSGHRFMWEWCHGPIPPAMEIHHKCRNIACMNPDHLELLTPIAHARTRRRCTHSDEERGGNTCRICNREWNRKRYANDEEYRENSLARSRERWRRKSVG